jgi:bile acid:Na+ symporter, BASS family
MNEIDAIVIRFNQDKLFILNISLAFIMYSIALDLRLSHFSAVVKYPKMVATGLSAQWVILPFMTLGLIFIWIPPASMALGMLLVAACPGGNVSNYAVHLSGGNTALSISLTTISTIAAIVMTPVLFEVIAPWIIDTRDAAVNISIPFSEMLKTIGLLIFLPLASGMATSSFFPKFTEKVQPYLKKLTMAVFLLIIIGGILANLDNIQKYLHLVFGLVVIHNGLALAGGYVWAWVWGQGERERRAISIETGIQNSGLGLILIFNFFGGNGGMALVAACWGIWHLISGVLLSLYWKSRTIKPV